MFYIYGLLDPNTKELRYIGKTNNLKVRYRDHINKLSETNYKANWIKSLKNNNLKPELIVLEKYENESDCFKAEIFLIEYFRSIGVNLTNLTNGGEGVSGIKPSEETKNKISLTHLGMKHTEETKEKLRQINIGKMVGKDHPNYGKQMPNDVKEKISKALIGRFVGDKNPSYGKKRSKNTLIKAVENRSDIKLSAQDIIEIKDLYAANIYSQKKIGEIYGVSNQHISRIINGTRGKYLP
jgi:group I intron endonuclease